jgi:hypothetical protein
MNTTSFSRVGFLPEETYFFRDGGINQFFPVYTKILPAETGHFGKMGQVDWKIPI